MDEKFYTTFYTKAVLPQFGIKTVEIVWGERRSLGPDESGWPFRIWDTHYMLFYEDFEGRFWGEAGVQELAGVKDFTYIEPVSRTKIAPSYDGLMLPTPYQYVKDVTGTFTLIKLTDKKES